MGLKEDLEAQAAEIFRKQWTAREGQVVPDPTDLGLANDGVRLDATVLYADMVGSTQLVDSYDDWFAAETYKAFLTCSARIIKSSDGVITAYDGDRIIAVYLGDTKNTRAVRTALKINYAMQNIIRPKLAAQYSGRIAYNPAHVVGIDTSKLLAARIGVRNDNDLVWVGRAANHAAKLCDIRRASYATWISKDVFTSMNEEVRTSSGRSMWEEFNWTAMADQKVYGSTWTWSF